MLARITVDAENGHLPDLFFIFACESAARKLATQCGMGGRVPGPIAELSWFPCDGQSRASRAEKMCHVCDKDAHHVYNCYVSLLSHYYR